MRRRHMYVRTRFGDFLQLVCRNLLTSLFLILAGEIWSCQSGYEYSLSLSACVATATGL